MTYWKLKWQEGGDQNIAKVLCKKFTNLLKAIAPSMISCRKEKLTKKHWTRDTFYRNKK